MKTVVIIPTYNEIDNVRQMVPTIKQLGLGVDILIVDDNSPDKTYEAVREMQKNDSSLHLLLRQQKNGLGKAYLAGFQWALERGYEAIVQMDCDFSHRPVDLQKILAQLPHSDFVIGSRYVSGGGTANWSFFRKCISLGGSLYARTILGLKIRDLTGGFNAWKSKVLKTMNLPAIQSNGYSFQIEMKYKATKLGFHSVEVPILFEDRRVGQSKMSSRIVIEALFRVWKIRQKSLS